MTPRPGGQRTNLRDIAHRAMIERGLEPDFPPDVREEAAAIPGPAREKDPSIRDLTDLLWASIDNDDSKDLDQLSVSEKLKGGAVKVLVAIADVDALVRKGSAIDRHARQNTTSVYTEAEIFPMLPLELSTGLTSLNENETRQAVVVEFTVDSGGEITRPDVYRALVLNRAQLAYDAVAAWLDGKGEMPARMAEVPGVDEQIRIQDAVAQKLKRRRHEEGALDLETIEARAVFDGDSLTDLALEPKNRAKELIEDFMIAANGVTARFLDRKGVSSLRRVVRSPERWQRIVEVASEHGGHLPPEPEARALEEFLVARREADPLRFPDLSLIVVKLMGRGEYVVERPGQTAVGHFGLAVADYTHSTAPNRRYPDLITQRILKAVLARRSSVYTDGELAGLAAHCTEQEDGATKVERQVRKSAAALLLQDRIGATFDGIITGASEKGTWARVFRPPVEGRLEHGYEGLRVGDKVRVKLISTNVERGYIDFGLAGG